ncbi:MAG: cell wall metabolism sensor histidine kinase WalK [Acidobacteria bacterium]|jgi:two-component system phosphate regulon sensor histidine kinase PhoR|nr:cell wall metabolism sensor histidine kinase WalK [Acidobacteriota bacterium]
MRVRRRLLGTFAAGATLAALAGLAAAVVVLGGGGEAAWRLLPFFLGPAVASIPLAGWLLRRHAARLDQVALVAERALAGAAEQPIPVPDERDEMARVTAAIESLRAALVLRVAAADRERTLLRSVIGRMREALGLVGADGRLELANDSFRALCSVRNDPTGRPLAEILRAPAVIDAVARVLAGDEDGELTWADPVSSRSFDVQVTAVPVNGGSRGAILLLYEITRLEALERVRREFVANVSHELRTPITSIKAAVETLLEDRCADAAIAMRFLGISARQVERMEALLADLTDLSLIETEAIKLDPVELDAGTVVRDVIAQHAHLAAEARVTLDSDLPGPLPLHADRRRLEQVLVNLVDNAIKFNRPGGRVTVRGRVVDGRPLIEVEDTGVGIPADALDRVFHRFFRIDPGVRERAGTGLGLAIVKHLMRLQGGQVRVESELGRGSKFVLSF